MATEKFEFWVHCPDRTDQGTFERRLAVRTQHLESAKKLFAVGFIKTAGALLSPESTEPNAVKKLVGSTFVVLSESIAEVRTVLEMDVYYTGNVWDTEKILILPFMAAKFDV